MGTLFTSCSLLSAWFSFSLFLFCLPDMCASAIFRKNQNKCKPSIFTQHWHWLIHFLSFRVGRSFWRKWKAVHTDLVGKLANKISINRTLNELYSCNDMKHLDDLAEDKFYHHKTSFKLDNMLNNLPAIIFVHLLSLILFLPKVTSFSLIIVWFVRNSTISSLY